MVYHRPKFKLSLFCLIAVAIYQLPSIAIAQTVERIRPFDPSGALVLVGGGEIDDELRSVFFELTRGERRQKKTLVIIPTASQRADKQEEAYWTKPWEESGFETIVVLHTRNRDVANSDEFTSQLRDASAIWFGGGDQSKLSAVYQGTRTENVLTELLNDGCVIGGTSAGAAIASRVMIAGGKQKPLVKQGLDLLPNAIVDQHFSQRQRQPRLEQALREHPSLIGIGIDESTAVVFRGRSMQVLGKGEATVIYPPTERAELLVRHLSPGQRDLDWTSIVRTQRERMLSEFPVEQQMKTPAIDAGSLMIVGGGGMSRELWSRFFELAGGKDAKIVVFPTAVPNPSKRSYEAGILRKLGAADVQVLNDTDPESINSEDFIGKIKQATGIWFSGGRQWRFVDLYQDTPAAEAMHQVIKDGGVIGGSSAGASIQGDLLIRGAPVGNWIMVQDGYRRGLGFLPGVGIDQHFSQRKRFKDLEGAIKKFPSILGIGIDESTALIVNQYQAEVAGEGSVFIYDAEAISERQDSPPEERPTRFKSGESFDLSEFSEQ